MHPQERAQAEDVIGELEAVKRQLGELKVEDLHKHQTEQIANQISAIQLHLTRLESDRASLNDATRTTP